MAAEVINFSIRMGEIYLKCKSTKNHHWIEENATSEPEFGIYFWWRCELCNTVRKDIVDRKNGNLLARWYEYPDGYRLISRMEIADWRLEQIKKRRAALTRLRRKKA